MTSGVRAVGRRVTLTASCSTGCSPGPTPSGRTTAAFRAIRAARPVTGHPAPPCSRPSHAGEPRSWGSTSRACSGWPPGFDKNAVGVDGLAAARLRLRRGRHRHRLSRSPATRGRGSSGCRATAAIVNRMGFNNDGAEAVAARLGAPAEDRSRCRVGHQHRQDQGGARGRRRRRLREERHACWRRTPTTWWSTSPRPTPRACATCRPSSSSSRCCCAVRRRSGRRRRPARAAAGQDRPRPGRRRRAGSGRPRGRRCRPRRRSSPPTPPSPATDLATPTAAVEAAGAGGLSGAPAARAGDRGGPAAARPRSGPDLAADRRRWHQHRRGRAASGWTRVPTWSRSTPASSTRVRCWPGGWPGSKPRSPSSRGGSTMTFGERAARRRWTAAARCARASTRTPACSTRGA